MTGGAMPLPTDWWWALSCIINARLGGSPNEPLCSRVYRQPPSLWRWVYLLAMDLLFMEAMHCCRVYWQWLMSTKR